MTMLQGVLDKATLARFSRFFRGERSSATNYISSLTKIDSVAFAAVPLMKTDSKGIEVMQAVNNDCNLNALFDEPDESRQVIGKNQI